MTTKTMKKTRESKKEQKKSHTVTGALIAIISFFWLAKEVEWIPVAAGGSQIFWPALIFAAGLAIFLSASHNRKEEN